MKVCSICKKNLSIDLFGKHKNSKDGIRSNCKKCNCELVKQYYWTNLEKCRTSQRERARKPEVLSKRREYKKTDKYRAWSREYVKTQKNKAWKIKSKIEWRLKNPEKKKAQAQAQWVHKEKKPCEWCGHSERVIRHHPDYNKPLEIMWLCNPCHSSWHKQFKAIPKRKENECLQYL